MDNKTLVFILNPTTLYRKVGSCQDWHQSHIHPAQPMTIRRSQAFRLAALLHTCARNRAQHQVFSTHPQAEGSTFLVSADSYTQLHPVYSPSSFRQRDFT